MSTFVFGDEDAVSHVSLGQNSAREPAWVLAPSLPSRRDSTEVYRTSCSQRREVFTDTGLVYSDCFDNTAPVRTDGRDVGLGKE